MFAAFFSFSYALIIFGLVGEADTDWLRVIGFIAASWMAIAGAISGWQGR
jgi:hypothetical protein